MTNVLIKRRLCSLWKISWKDWASENCTKLNLERSASPFRHSRKNSRISLNTLVDYPFKKPLNVESTSKWIKALNPGLNYQGVIKKYCKHKCTHKYHVLCYGCAVAESQAVQHSVRDESAKFAREIFHISNDWYLQSFQSVFYEMRTQVQ